MEQNRTEQCHLLPPGHVSPRLTPELTSPHLTSRQLACEAHSRFHITCYRMLIPQHQGLLEADDHPTRIHIHTRAVGEGEGGGGGGRWRRLTSPPPPLGPMKPGRFCVWTKNTAPRTQTRPDQTTTDSGCCERTLNGRAGEASKASIPPLPSPTDPALPQAPASPTRSR
jgi:hypothetical protein